MSKNFFLSFSQTSGIHFFINSSLSFGLYFLKNLKTDVISFLRPSYKKLQYSNNKSHLVNLVALDLFHTDC